MSDWFTAALDIQREIVRAQRSQFDAAERMLDGARQLSAMQEAGRKAAEANYDIWTQWMKFWGFK
jgi:hypothetical protein